MEMDISLIEELEKKVAHNNAIGVDYENIDELAYLALGLHRTILNKIEFFNIGTYHDFYILRTNEEMDLDTVTITGTTLHILSQLKQYVNNIKSKSITLPSRQARQKIDEIAKNFKNREFFPESNQRAREALKNLKKLPR